MTYANLDSAFAIRRGWFVVRRIALQQLGFRTDRHCCKLLLSGRVRPHRTCTFVSLSRRVSEDTQPRRHNCEMYTEDGHIWPVSWHRQAGGDSHLALYALCAALHDIPNCGLFREARAAFREWNGEWRRAYCCEAWWILSQSIRTGQSAYMDVQGNHLDFCELQCSRGGKCSVTVFSIVPIVN